MAAHYLPKRRLYGISLTTFKNICNGGNRDGLIPGEFTGERMAWASPYMLAAFLDTS